MKILTIDGKAFQIVEDAAGHHLMAEGRSVCTPDGSPIVALSSRLPDLLIEEWQGRGEILIREDGVVTSPNFVGAYGFLFVQKAYVSGGLEDLAVGMATCLLHDPMLYPPVSEDAVRRTQMVWEPVFSMLAREGVYLPNLRAHAEALALDALDVDAAFAVLGEHLSPAFVSGISRLYHRLPEPGRAVATFLQAIHRSVLYPIALLSGECSPRDYAEGIGSLASSYLFELRAVDDKKPLESLASLRKHAQAGLRYVASTQPECSLPEVFAKGVRAQIDFALSFRATTFSKGPLHSAMGSWLRMVAGFLNGDGGRLYVGVGRDGTVFGVEGDGVTSLGALTDLVEGALRGYIGAFAVPLVHCGLVRVAGHLVATIDCEVSPERVLMDEITGETLYLIRKGRQTFTQRYDRQRGLLVGARTPYPGNS